MTALCGLGEIIGRANWESAVLKRSQMQHRWEHQPIGLGSGPEVFNLLVCNRMAVFGFGDLSRATPKTQTRLLCRPASSRMQVGGMCVLGISLCLRSSQTGPFGVGGEWQMSIQKCAIRA